MLPDNMLSSAAIFGGFLVPDRINDLIDYEWGGKDLLDASEGMQVKIWTCFYEDGWIKITDNAGLRYSILEVAEVTQLGFAFSLSMRVYVTYVAAGRAFFYWYDSTTSAYITTDYGVETITPQLSLDDVRNSQSSNADVIIAYVRDDVLYTRMQRDRFQIEYEMGAANQLVQIGMTSNYRFAFALKAVINRFNTHYDQALIDPRNIQGNRFDHLDLSALQASYAVQLGNSVIVSEGLTDNRYRTGFDNLVNVVAVNFNLSAEDYTYFTAFYRVWQNKRKPFTFNAVIDSRASQQYKAHFVPDSISMSKNGKLFKVSAQLHVLNNPFNKAAIQTLAESRNDQST
jgi:hypothetical protein